MNLIVFDQAVYDRILGDVDKDAWAKTQIQAHNLTEGLVGVLCVQETCSTFYVASGEGRPCYAPTKKPQRVLYYYFLDRDFGLMHVRLQTWIPFTCQIYVNGHDFVARKLAQKGVKFEQIDNAFVQTDDPGQTQKIADRFAELAICITIKAMPYRAIIGI